MFRPSALGRTRSALCSDQVGGKGVRSEFSCFGKFYCLVEKKLWSESEFIIKVIIYYINSSQCPHLHFALRPEPADITQPSSSLEIHSSVLLESGKQISTRKYLEQRAIVRGPTPVGSVSSEQGCYAALATGDSLMSRQSSRTAGRGQLWVGVPGSCQRVMKHSVPFESRREPGAERRRERLCR